MGVVASALFLAAVTSIAIWNARRRPYLLVGWLWYLVGFLPMIGLVQVGPQRMADRYAYFPMLGAYLIVAWVLPSIVPVAWSRGRVLGVLAAATIAVYATIAFFQVGYWRDSITLYTHALAVVDDNAEGADAPRQRTACSRARR